MHSFNSEFLQHISCVLNQKIEPTFSFTKFGRDPIKGCSVLLNAIVEMLIAGFWENVVREE